MLDEDGTQENSKSRTKLTPLMAVNVLHFMKNSGLMPNNNIISKEIAMKIKKKKVAPLLCNSVLKSSANVDFPSNLTLSISLHRPPIPMA